MTNSKAKSSLFDFCSSKNARGLHGVYDQHCLNEDGTVMDVLDQAAAISHYLQLRGSKYASAFLERGEGLIQLWKSFLDGDADYGGDAVSEAAPLYFGSFFSEVYKAPFQSAGKRI